MDWWIKMCWFEGWCSHVQEHLIGTQNNETPRHSLQKQTVKESFLYQPFLGSKALKVLFALLYNLLREVGPSALALIKTKLRCRLQPGRAFKCSFSIHDCGLKKFQSVWKIKIYINIPITVAIMYCDSHIFFSKIILYYQLIVTIFLYYYFKSD